MIDFTKILKDISEINNQEQFSKYLESYFLEIEEYFNNLAFDEINDLKFDIEDLLYDLEDNKLVLNENTNIVNAFLILLAQKFEQSNLIGAITNIYNYLPDCNIKKRLEASKIYLKSNDITKDYHNNFEKVIMLIELSVSEDEGNQRAINSIINFYTIAFSHFKRIKNKELADSFRSLFLNKLDKYKILANDSIQKVISSVTYENFETKIIEITQEINNDIKSKSCEVTPNIITKENSKYHTKLHSLKNPTFKEIQRLSFDYIKAIEDPQELYDKLNRGTVIIDDERLLYKYIAAFGTKHKEKLYDSFEVIKNKLDNQKINIIDWGCGQAFATMILLDFIKEKNINLEISDICLIEPSKLALERGLLHLDVLKHNKCTIKAINNDLDCLKQEDILFDNDNKILHLFSNILDLESFKLNTDFLQKISKNINSDNMFVCVSPNINDKRNSRIDLFYNHFNENFNTELISSRADDVSGNKRYEKIFEVIYAKPQEIIQIREEVKEYNFDIYSKLEKYAQVIEPILDSSKVKENIEKDPDYVIFKIRKVTEVLTSKIYSKYETNENRISQNDKIRYLTYANIINRKIQSHLHTIRTIGNIGAHEHIDNPIEMLTEDAYFLTTALILLIEELLKQNIIVLDN